MVRIYELNYQGLCLYVGKTKQLLYFRGKKHQSKGNTSNSRNIPDELCPWEIKLLEECDDKDGTAREQHWYDTLMPLYNICRPGNTYEDYVASGKAKEKTHKYIHSEKRRETQRLYRSTEKYKEYRKQYRAKKKQPTDATSFSLH